MIFAFFQVLATFLAYLTSVQKNEYTYKKVGDIKLDLVVYQPTYNTSAINKLSSPVLLAIHGGGFVFGEKDGEGAISDREIKEFASRGWTIVSINHRLAPPSFLSDIVQDMQAAYKWIKNKLPAKNLSAVDPDLVCVFGKSAGGGLALMGGKHLHPRFPCIISFYPYGASLLDNDFYDPTTSPSEELVAAVKRLKAVTIESPRSKLPTDDRNTVFKLSIKEKKGGWLLATHNPKEDPKIVRARLKEWSPIDNIDQHYPPTWLAHGMDDSLVPYEQSVKMKEKLEKHNRAVVLDLPPNEGHVFDERGGESVWKNHVIPALDWAAIQIQNYKRE